MPVLVNQDILGGWHNVIPGVTGEFFKDENDISQQLNKILSNPYTPREWYQRNRGKTISGKVLAQFLIEHFPDLNNKNMEYATITI